MMIEKLSVKSADGAMLSVVLGGDLMAAKGVVIISHGFGEHIGGYADFGERLWEFGYASAVFDQRGHGDIPPKKRGVMPGFTSFGDDIAAVFAAVQKKAPSLPFALFGHSMGGNIAANYLLRFGEEGFACAVLESPWLGLYNEPKPPVAAIAKLIGKFSSSIGIYNKLPEEDVTSTPEKAQEIADDKVYHNRISFRMFTVIRQGCKDALAGASRLKLPIFLAYAEDDRIVSNPAIHSFHASCGKKVEIKGYPGRHMIHNDISAKEFYSDMAAYLDKYMRIESEGTL